MITFFPGRQRQRDLADTASHRCNFSGTTPPTSDDIPTTATSFTGTSPEVNTTNLIHQFLCPRTNMRTDECGGGSYANRIRFAIEIVFGFCSKLPSSFIIVFPLSMLDLVENASTWEEIVLLTKELEYAGITRLNTGIGWHEARVPTIATLVPRGAFAWETHNMKRHVANLPVCTSKRIDAPEKVEQILSYGQADFVSMAHPFLADLEFIRRTRNASRRNLYLYCLQSSLPGPDVQQLPKRTDGLNVNKNLEISGQFNMAKHIPGNQEFYESLRYFDVRMKKFGVKRSLGVKVESVSDLLHHHDVDSSISSMPPDVLVVAIDVKPRIQLILNIPKC
jgi:2,4-dienoyl-CoA reductase (NADPH2)